MFRPCGPRLSWNASICSGNIFSLTSLRLSSLMGVLFRKLLMDSGSSPYVMWKCPKSKGSTTNRIDLCRQIWDSGRFPHRAVELTCLSPVELVKSSRELRYSGSDWRMPFRCWRLSLVLSKYLSFYWFFTQLRLTEVAFHMSNIVISISFCHTCLSHSLNEHFQHFWFWKSSYLAAVFPLPKLIHDLYWDQQYLI